MWWRRLRYVLLLLALCTIATCPAAKRACVARTRSQEAHELLAYLADRVASSLTEKGRVPELATGPTPATRCCEQGGTCAAEATQWQTPGWRALAFSVDDDHRFVYEYSPDPSGHAAVVRATGDVACSGTTSVFEIEIRLGQHGIERKTSRKLTHP